MRMRFSLMVVSTVLVMLEGCDGNGGNGDGGQLDPPIGDISGRWAVTTTTTQASSVCSDEIGSQDFDIVTVTQTNNDIAVTFTNELGGLSTLTGTLERSTLTLQGSAPEDGGTTTGTGSFQVAEDCNRFSGTTNWQWSGGEQSCSGVDEVNGLRQDPVGCDSGS